MPSAPSVVETIAFPIAIASTILSRVPPPSRSGTTTAADMYFFPEAAARAYLAAGMRAVLGMPVLDLPMAGAADADAHLARGLAARDALKGEPLLRFALAPHAPYTVGDATWHKLVTLAREIDLPIVTHLQETRAERDDALARDGMTPLARLDRLGQYLADHPEEDDEEEGPPS